MSAEYRNQGVWAGYAPASGPRNLMALVKTRRKLVMLGAVAGLIVSGLVQLLEPPVYLSRSMLQVQNFSIGRSVDPQPVVLGDTLTERTRVNNTLAILRSDKFLTALAKEIQAGNFEDKMVLTWGVGLRIRANYALYRLGVAKIKFEKVNPTKLSLRDLGILIGPMINLVPDYDDMTIEISVKALEPMTAFYINSLVSKAFMAATDALGQAEVALSTDFFNEQLKASQERLTASQDELKQFMLLHPNLSSSEAKSTILQEYSDLIKRQNTLEAKIEAGRNLYDYYKKRILEPASSSEVPVEAVNRVRSEMASLEFERSSFLREGYAATHPKVQQLSDRIAKLSQVMLELQSHIQLNSQDFLSLDYQDGAGKRVGELVDGLKSSELELDSVKKSLRELQPKVQSLPKDDFKLGELQREVKLSTELVEELGRRVQLSKVREAGERGMLRELNPPTLQLIPVNLPTWSHRLFGGLAGALLVISLLFLSDLTTPRIFTRADAEAAGFGYAGVWSPKAAASALILSNLGLLGRADDGPNRAKVILCSGPMDGLTFSQLVPLAKYLEANRKKTLVITVGHNHQKIDGLDVIYLGNDESIEKLQAIVEENLNTRQSIWIFPENGTENSCYGLALQLADHLLLVGESSMHTPDDFSEFSHGFTKLHEAFIALAPPRDRTTRELLQRSIYSGGAISVLAQKGASLKRWNPLKRRDRETEL